SASTNTSRTVSKHARHCCSMSYLTILSAESSVTPGIFLLPRTRGPIPERNRRLLTRFACGNAPTGSGARELSNDLLIIAVHTSRTSEDPDPFGPTAARRKSTYSLSV